ncbi:MAG TPA: copper homeostasis protein CutC [Bacteroidia bacterium]|nr:copper homeostasis protein CutC [Bacteroidia bacterium]
MYSRSEYLFEACVDSVADAIAAEASGVDRIELCGALSEGGLTPPLSLAEEVVKRVSIPVHIMIRPRSGDFYYTDEEYRLMIADVHHAKSAGAAGVVVGLLLTDGSIDIERSAQLMTAARPLKVVFHRAFDMTADPFLALEEIVGLGADAILTSGHRQAAEDGLDLIKELIKRAHQRVQIVAGGGINSGNVKLLAGAGVRNFHFTVRMQTDSPMHYRNDVLNGMGSRSGTEYIRYIYDKDKVSGIMDALS